MKIINKEQKIKCEECKAELIVEESDERKYGNYGIPYVTCLACGAEIKLEEEEGLKITSNNIKFPEHFYHFGQKDGKKLTKEEIQEYVERVAKGMEEDKEAHFYCTGTGNTMVIALRWEDELQIIVAPDYYELSYEEN